jgi:diguanylate cyclase (GGDEF)-like protein
MTLIGSKETNSDGRSQQELETLMEIGKALTSLLDIEEVYQVVMDKISRLLRPDSWSLLMVDETTEELSFVIAVSPAAAELKKVRLAPGEGIAGWVARHGEPLLVPDVSRDDRFSAHVDRRSGFTTRSIICVPLKARERTLGVIQLINGMDQGEFARTDLNILSTIADFAAIAIDNARLIEKINQLTITDELTGIYNDRHFHALLEYEIERARRAATALSLVFIDLDHFKQVNDTFGHLTGSRLLKEVGQVIREKTRRINHAARYGGDEFVILLPGTDQEGALGMTNNLRKNLQNEDFRADDGTPLKVTASFGIATYPVHASTKEELLRLADEAMYDVKKSTRDGVKVA